MATSRRAKLSSNSKERPYADLALEIASKAGGLTLTNRMQLLVDSVWQSLHVTGVSWIGFYLDQPDQPPSSRLVLGPCRDKPACSPIGLHGVCGTALSTRRVQIVDDVRQLGAHYIACDPRDRSEIVIPLIDIDARCWAVLDVDSWDIAAFDAVDATGLDCLLRAGALLP